MAEQVYTGSNFKNKQMKVYIHVKIEEVGEVQQALRGGGVNTWIFPEGEVKNVPTGCVCVKITSRSAAAMFNAGWRARDFFVTRVIKQNDEKISR